MASIGARLRKAAKKNTAAREAARPKPPQPTPKKKKGSSQDPGAVAKPAPSSGSIPKMAPTKAEAAAQDPGSYASRPAAKKVATQIKSGATWLSHDDPYNMLLKKGLS